MLRRKHLSPESNSASDFETLFARYATPIYRFCLRLCRNPADAEDLMQEVFLAAFLGRARYVGRGSLLTYLYRIAVFRWRTLRDKAHRANAAESALGRQQAEASPDIAPATVERAGLDAALRALDERHRTAFLLVKGEGMTCREAAAVLGLPEGTVKYHVHEAVRHLQLALASDEMTAVPRRAKAPSGEVCHDL